MSTEQSYVGRGDSASPNKPSAHYIPQTGQNRPPTAQKQGQPSQPPFDPCDPARTLNDLTSELVQACQDFSEFKNPTPYLIELIQKWTYRNEDFNADENRGALRQLLTVVSFINEVRRLSDQIEFFAGEVKEKEVSRD